MSDMDIGLSLDYVKRRVAFEFNPLGMAG